MNLLMTSSRGVGIEGKIRDDVLEWGGLTTKVISGGTFSELAEAAITLLPPPSHNSNTPHVYFLAGIPDATTLLKDDNPGQNYKEVILTKSEQELIDHLRLEIVTTSNRIRDAGGRPIFSTITNIDLTKYNTSLLKRGKTHALQHQDSYDTMQTQLDNIFTQTNNFIVNHNRHNNVATPHCHSAIRKHKGRSGAGYYFTDYQMLYDGIHGGDKAKSLWAKAIKGAIKKNYDRFCEDFPSSPKRSWRGEKRGFHQV